jgi:hypothetical protein
VSFPLPFPLPLWLIAVGALLALGVWFVYEHYLHPAWRRQRRVLRACEKAFDDKEYQLERFRVSPDDPSIADLFPASPFGSGESSRYFTYKIKTPEGVEPEFSGMDSNEIDLVRHYLRREVHVPHFGKKMLRPEESDPPVNNHSAVQA